MKAITPGGMIRASETGSRLLASAVRRKRVRAISRVYGGGRTSRKCLSGATPRYPSASAAFASLATCASATSTQRAT
jgi:hypothetical protein